LLKERKEERRKGKGGRQEGRKAGRQEERKEGKEGKKTLQKVCWSKQ